MVYTCILSRLPTEIITVNDINGHSLKDTYVRRRENCCFTTTVCS